MSYYDFENRLFLTLLELEENGESEPVDLQGVCDQIALATNDEWLIKFINDNDRFGSGNAFTDTTYFKLNREGKAHAETIRAEVQSKTFRGRVASITRSDWIAFGALIVSLLGVVFD